MQHSSSSFAIYNFRNSLPLTFYTQIVNIQTKGIYQIKSIRSSKKKPDAYVIARFPPSSINIIVEGNIDIRKFYYLYSIKNHTHHSIRIGKLKPLDTVSKSAHITSKASYPHVITVSKSYIIQCIKIIGFKPHFASSRRKVHCSFINVIDECMICRVTKSIGILSSGRRFFKTGIS